MPQQLSDRARSESRSIAERRTHIRIDGSSGREVAGELKRFRVDAGCCVAILSILAAGSGLELQAANHVLFVELSFNADDLLQAEARAYRIGQTRQVETTYLLAKDTVESDVFDIVQRKLCNISSVLNNEVSSFGATLNTVVDKPCNIQT
jgi:SWI/SNF-related matrix-associated actin-dependent regulator 1 of chromatin subfamily A